MDAQVGRLLDTLDRLQLWEQHDHHLCRRQRLSSQRAQLVEQEHAVRTQLPCAADHCRSRGQSGQRLPVTCRTRRSLPDRGGLLRRAGASFPGGARACGLCWRTRLLLANRLPIRSSPAEPANTVRRCAPTAGATSNGVTASANSTTNSAIARKHAIFPTTLPAVPRLPR